MLDRKVVEEFVLERLKETNSPIPKFVKKKELVEAFCQFTEDDYYEWLKDNFSTFFNHGNPDWVWIEKYIAEHKK
jgi:hypothetical protein